MAAYAALVALFNDLQLIPNHLVHSFSFDHKQLSSLTQTVEFLIDFMEGYDSHGSTREAMEALESRIATAAHAAHDVIQSHLVNQIHAGSTRDGKVRSYFLLDLQKAMDNMEFVKRKTMRFKARSGSMAEQPTYSSKTTTSFQPPKNAMVGFDEVVLRLMHILTGEPSGQRLIIPIAGMGGLGKTSLAKTVYEHSSLEGYFDVRLWATISQQYSAQSILSELLRKSTTGGNVNELGEELRKNKLWNRRYLVVLDDMWSLEAWNEIQIYLPDNGNGSRIVVTTRLSDLAAHFSFYPFKLDFLNEDKSWELFCGKTFGEEKCPVKLEEIGKKIVKRCGGLPLAIVVIGGHLRKSSRGIEYWEKFASYMNPISSIAEEQQCLEILSLSYQHLPAHLKPCFLYLATFKEDVVIGGERLLQYWVAEGILRPKKGLSLEEVGEDCLKDLVDRNLIIVHEYGDWWPTRDKYYKIHDTMRELCLKACKKEKFWCVVEDSTQATIRRERRLVIVEQEKFNSEVIGANQSAPPLYSLVYGGNDYFLNELLVDCKLLRVLLVQEKDVDGERRSTSVPPPQAQHVNLRALSFEKQTRFFTEPVYSTLSSISTASWNLQLLYVVMGCDNEPIDLPFVIWEMPQLRHLKIHEIFLPEPACCPGSTQQECIVLQNLQTLGYIVNLRLTEEVCKRMPNLKKLILRYRLHDDYSFHNLDRFNKLKWLYIVFTGDSMWRDVLLSLTFPTSLEELYLLNSHLRWEDLTIMISSLPLLECLRVSLVSGSEWNLDKEEFHCLKTLDIYSCYDLIYLNVNLDNFPVLETLSLHYLRKLSEIPLDIGEIPTLRLIELKDCSTSAAVSAMRMVVEQETSGNSDLQLSFHFWEHEEVERFQKMLHEECLTSINLRLYTLQEKMAYATYVMRYHR